MKINCEIIISIRPKWCKKIFSGEKNIEIRKSIPHNGIPFKAYVYETKPGSAAIIGEFIVNGFWFDYQNKDGGNSCLTDAEIMEYGTAYGWHIAEYKTYDTPKRLSDFNLKRAPQSWCYTKEIQP